MVYDIDSELRRLAANDPKLDYVHGHVNTSDCAAYAEALKGNTHVRNLYIDVGLPLTPGEREKAMTSWKSFCEVAQELSSLQEVEIHLPADDEGENPTLQDFIVVGLVLQHLCQVKEIHLDREEREQITDPAYGYIIARNIANHPTLERFTLKEFECSRDDSSLPAVLEALLTVPNLKGVELIPSYGFQEDEALSAECNDVKAGRGYLGDENKGPECQAAGVNVLSNVSDDLDCIFYHLRENPLLCDLHAMATLGSSKKRRTSAEP